MNELTKGQKRIIRIAGIVLGLVLWIAWRGFHPSMWFTVALFALIELVSFVRKK